MEIKQTGLLETLKAKALLGLPVDTSDVVALGDIVNHNTKMLGAVSDKLDALIFHVGETLIAVSDVQELHQELHEKTTDTLEELGEVVDTLDSDMDEVYDDLNACAGDDDGTYYRASEMPDDDDNEVFLGAFGDVIGELNSLFSGGIGKVCQQAEDGEPDPVEENLKLITSAFFVPNDLTGRP